MDGAVQCCHHGGIAQQEKCKFCVPTARARNDEINNKTFEKPVLIE
jgi:hypothetical protein